MERTELNTREGEKGFTLVELAVVMIIIGLLIGGVLKGQELIANAQIAATVAQVKAIDAATTTFRDKYDAFPGDMVGSTTRLPNCTAAPCSTAGNGNGRLDNAGVAVAPGAAPVGESPQFFTHLSAADLVTGITSASATVTSPWGTLFPEAEIGGGFMPAFHTGGALGGNGNAPAGHYLSLTLTAGVAAPSPGTTLNANEAFRIDTKIDDGAPLTGSVFPTGSGDCDDGATPAVYTEANTAQTCDLFIRFQS